MDYVVDEASGVVLDRAERRPMSDGRDGVFQGQATQESVDAMIAYVDALPNPAVRTWAVRVAGVVGGLLPHSGYLWARRGLCTGFLVAVCRLGFCVDCYFVSVGTLDSPGR